ncbi:MAG: GatB/YqeY domain-containing protein [bacterium]|nr:GatB/YqeY domain-containing protein [Mycoplasmatota bacterium]MDD6757793.1 GatB/YqeY domain-containing protein [bacterium]MDY2907679.1 GatB/YqeY domain-containing protein [Candidatus Faecimonas sp.]
MVEKLKQDMIAAMKAKDKDRLTTIRMIKGDLDKEHIDKKREINDDLLIEVVNRGIKQRKDSIVEFEKGGRDDLIQKTQAELEILQSYLPAQLSEEEIVSIIDEAFQIVNPEGPRDMGKIMKEVQPKLKGRADMKEVSEIIKAKLQ